VEDDGETYRVDKHGRGRSDYPADRSLWEQHNKRPDVDKLGDHTCRDFDIDQRRFDDQQVPRLHGHGHRRHQRPIVQRVGLAGHATGGRR
jgi:hypothetical protein